VETATPLRFATSPTVSSRDICVERGFFIISLDLKCT
jgi:hypothetical protein